MFQLSRQGVIDVVSGRQPLNRDSTDKVRELLDESLTTGQPRIVVNLDEIPLIDSAGLELLLDVRDDCRQRGGTLQLAAPNPLCRDILHLTGLDQQIDVYDDVLSAVGSFVE